MPGLLTGGLGPATDAGAVATSYRAVGIPTLPTVGTTYTVTFVLDGPASVSGSVTPVPVTGISWGASAAISVGATSGSTTVTFTTAGTYTPTFNHAGLGFSGDPSGSVVTASAGSSGDPTSIANAVVSALNATSIPVNVVQIAGSTTAATNQHDDLLSVPVQVSDIATATATATATLMGSLKLDVATVLASPAPTTTTFSANVASQDGVAVTTGAGGFVGMNAIPQGNLNFKRTITSHTIVGPRHDFVIDSANPWPTGVPASGDKVILG